MEEANFKNILDVLKREWPIAELNVRAVIEERDALRAALEGLLAVCSCDNDCAPDDMTCATNAARKALGKQG